MKNFKWWILFVYGAVSLNSCNLNTEPKFLVATASNTQYVMRKLIEEFAQNYAIKGELMVSSSGKLTAQIKEGAPYDVFISANLKYPMNLYEAGLCDKPTVFAYGNLVLWSPHNGNKFSLNVLKSENISNLALANPKTAPFGMAAKETLINLNLYQKLEKNLVYGESIAQVNHFIGSASVDFGFTSKSTVYSEKAKDIGQWVEVPPHMYTPIPQTAVVLKKEMKNRNLAIEFLAFLASAQAEEIIEKHGYKLKANE